MAVLRCSVSGCERKHHAKGYCNKHYNKWRVYGDPVAGRFLDTTPIWTRKQYPKKSRSLQAAPDLKKRQPLPTAAEWIPEPKKERSAPGSQSNLSFFLNQRFIEKIYTEILKADKEPLYKSSNYVLINDMLHLAAGLAGYDSKDADIWNEFSKELLKWTGTRDKIRFMETLANWPQRVKLYQPKKAIQLSFDSMQPNKTNSR